VAVAADRLGKERAVKKELKRLEEIFSCLERNKFETMRGLIQTVAYLSVSARELEKIINENGYLEEYQNGEKQKGVKQSEYVKIYTAYCKQLVSAIKTLVAEAPPAKKKSLLNELKNEK